MKKLFPVLYHKGKSGKLYSWEVKAEDGVVTVTAGTVDGKKTISPKKVEQKNVGKSNETSLSEQAIKEAQALWTFKIERKYSLTKELAKEESNLPMLADDFAKRFKTITPEQWKKGLFVQPKLDGVRCLAEIEENVTTLTSRSGKPWLATPHINSQLQSFSLSNTILDGELYIHGYTFQEITRLVKSAKPESSKIEYHVYDIPVYAGNEGKTWEEREKDLQHLFKNKGIDNLNIVLVKSEIAYSYEDVIKIHDKFVEAGYEGAIVRTRIGQYLFGYRSKDLLKVKQFEDAEFAVTGYTRGVGKYENSVIWVCKTEDEKPFNVNPKVSIAEKEEYLKNAKDYVGQLLKVKFFGRSENKTPRFPVGLGFRLKEDMDK